jgi:outer membrane protein W
MIKTIMTMVVSAFLGMLLAQGAHAQGIGPQGGDLSFSLIFGKAQMVAGDFIGFGEVDQVPNSNIWNTDTYITVPSLNFSSGNTVTSMVGVEAKYFMTPQIAIRFSGSGAINSSPSRDATPAVAPDYNADMSPGTFIPGFMMTEGRTLGQFFATLGGDYYFATKREKVHPYAGVQINGAYGLMEIFDGYRGIIIEEDPLEAGPGPKRLVMPNSDGVITTWDTRRGEAWGIGTSLVGGVDYFLAEGFFFGFEIKAASYMYTGKRLFHQPGMEAQEASTFNTAFLAMPMVKLGFSF